MATGVRGLKRLFPNTGALWRRIDAYVANKSVPRVALIPWGLPRKACAPLLDALVADPLDPDESKWSEALANRPFTKDTIVVQSPSFEYIETQNSMVRYPIPFSGPPVEYVEVSGVEDSQEHIESSDLHVFICSPQKTPPAIDFPSLRVVLDSHEHNGVQTPFQKVCYQMETLPIDLEKYSSACALLRESPANVSTYADLAKRSGIFHLKETLTDPKAIRNALLQSIITTCESRVDLATKSLSQNSSLNAEIQALRREWASSAHRELQRNVLPSLEKLLTKDLAWYKLYGRADDVETTLTEWLSWRYMPSAKSGIQYVTGRIDQAVPPILAAAASRNPQVFLNEALTHCELLSMSLQKKVVYAVLTALGVQIPLALSALAGVIWGGYSMYTMTALAGLGIVVGLNRMQKIWLNAIKNYQESVKASSIAAINRTEQSLYELYEDQVLQQKSSLDNQRKAISDIKANVSGKGI